MDGCMMDGWYLVGRKEEIEDQIRRREWWNRDGRGNR